MYNKLNHVIYFALLISFINLSNIDNQNNRPEYILPNVIRTESTKTTLNSFTKLKTKISTSLKSFCKCFKRSRNNPSSINIQVEEEQVKNRSFSSVPAFKSSPSNNNTQTLYNKPFICGLEDFEYKPDKNPSFLSPQTIPIRKKHTTEFVKERYEIPETKIYESTMIMINKLNKYLKEEKDKLFLILNELNEGENTEYSSFDKKCIDLYRITVKEHIDQIDKLEHKIEKSTQFEKKDESIIKEIKIENLDSCENKTPKKKKKAVNMNSPKTPNSSRNVKSTIQIKTPDSTKSQKQPKSTKSIKTPKSDYLDKICAVPQIKTLCDIEEDEEFDYKYNLDYAQHLENKIEKIIVHFKTLEALIRQFKIKQKIVNGNCYNCDIENSNLVNKVDLSLELIELNQSLKQQQKYFCIYSNKIVYYENKNKIDLDSGYKIKKRKCLSAKTLKE